MLVVLSIMDWEFYMYKLEEKDVEWAIRHLNNFADSDFFPRLFEFTCINHNWTTVKDYILNLEFGKDGYTPKSPLHYLAFKNNFSFRIVHQLDPIDSIIFTAFIHNISGYIEKYRIPEERNIACSYRIKSTIDGSFFDKGENGWLKYKSKISDLVKLNNGGYIIECDLVDFYNQIYTHRIQNIISEAGKGDLDDISQEIERFIMGLNKNTSRGIPVGPAASIILAEAIMLDIDKKIISLTSNFTRYVDDIKIYAATIEEAERILYELTEYLYSPHRLVLSSEKTRIIEVDKYEKEYFKDEEKIEKQQFNEEAENKVNELIDEILEEFDEDSSPYDEPEFDYDEILERVLEEEKLNILTKAYKKILVSNLEEDFNVGVVRHLYRKATIVRLRGIIRFTLKNIEFFLPAIREIIIFLNKVLNKKNLKIYEEELKRIIDLERLWNNPFINKWLSFLFQNPIINELDYDVEYKQILEIRDQALIALRKFDVIWIKKYKENIDSLNDWDKRAVLYASQILSYDEMSKWGPSVIRKDILLKSIFNKIKSDKKK